MRSRPIARQDGIKEAEAAFRVIPKPYQQAAFATGHRSTFLRCCKPRQRGANGEGADCAGNRSSLRTTSLTETIVTPARSSACVASAIAVSSAADLMVSS